MTSDQAHALVDAPILFITAVTALITTYNKLKNDEIHKDIKSLNDQVVAKNGSDHTDQGDKSPT